MAEELQRTVNGDLTSEKKKLFSAILNEITPFLNAEIFSFSDVLENVLKLQEHGDHVQEADVDLYLSTNKLVAGATVQMNLYEKCSDSDKIKVLEILTKREENQHLNLVSYYNLNTLLQKMDFTEFKRFVFPLIQSTLSTSWEEQNLATLYLLTVVQEIFPECVPGNFLEDNLGTSEILCPESLNYLCQILIKSPETLSLRHPIFEILIKKLSASDLSEQFFAKLDIVMRFQDSNEYCTFTTMLTGALKNTKNPEVIPNILTTNYLEEIVAMCIEMGGTWDTELHVLTRKLFDTLACRLKNSRNSEIVIKALRKLVFNPKVFVSFKNEYNTGVHIILGILTIEGIKEMGDIFKNYILEANGEFPQEMYNIASLLMELMEYPVMNGESEWKIELLIFVAKQGLLKDQSDDNPQSSAFLLAETLYSFLYFETSKYHDIGNIISKVLNEFIKVIGGGNWNILIRPLKQKYHRTWQKALEIITDLDRSLHDRDIVVHYLCSLFCLQLFSNAKLASECLTDVFGCYESTKNPTDFEDENIVWMEIVDLFLTLLSHDCWHVLDLINHVFPIVCNYIDSTMLHQILYILDPDVSSISVPSLHIDGEEYPVQEDDDLNLSIGPNKEARMDYRIRVLNLIEIYLKHNPSMLLTLEIMSTLMRVLQFCVKAGNPEKELLGKVTESLKLFPLLPLNESKDVTEEFLVELLTKLFYNLKSEPAVVQNMSEAIVDCSIYALNCSQHLNIVAVENSENVQKTNLHELMEHAVRGFFMSDSPILYDVLTELFRRSWNRVQVFSLLPKVFRFVFARRSYRRRDQALELAKLFLGNRQYIDSHLERMKIIAKDIVTFLDDCVGFFRKLTEEPTKRKFKLEACLLNDDGICFGKCRLGSAKDKFLCNLLQLLCDIKASAIGGMFQTWPALKFEARPCSQLDLSQDALEALGKFCDESFTTRRFCQKCKEAENANQ